MTRPGRRHILFVCTMNKARSIAAERLYRRTPGLAVRSASIDERAAHQLTGDDLAWADQVIVFEPKHAAWIHRTFAGELPPVLDLGIPDDVPADDPRLVAELREALVPLLGEPGRGR